MAAIGEMEQAGEVRQGRRSQKEFIYVRVQNPTIHSTHDEGRFLTFEIFVQTNSLSFALQGSKTRRRHSDFNWLKRTLSRTTDYAKTPSLPLPLGLLFGVYRANFLEERQVELTTFLEKLVRESPFLSNPALHLFLQTAFTVNQMETILNAIRKRESVDDIITVIKKFRSKRRHHSTTRDQDKSPGDGKLKDTDSLNSRNRKSRFTASFNYGNGSWTHSPSVTHTPPEGTVVQGSVGSNSETSCSPISSGDEKNERTRASTSVDVVRDVIDSSSPRVGAMSPEDYTPVTWREFRRTKFIHSCMIPGGLKAIERPNSFKPRSLENSFFQSSQKKNKDVRRRSDAGIWRKPSSSPDAQKQSISDASLSLLKEQDKENEERVAKNVTNDFTVVSLKVADAAKNSDEEETLTSDCSSEEGDTNSVITMEAANEQKHVEITIESSTSKSLASLKDESIKREDESNKDQSDSNQCEEDTNNFKDDSSKSRTG